MPTPIEDPRDFSAAPFVAGCFTGRRTFRAWEDPDGDIGLWGPIYEFPWSVTDVNEAVCQRQPWSLQATPKHSKVPAAGCKCGFWAYASETPQERTYKKPAIVGTEGSIFSIEGIIFGWGTCRIGPKGFRSQKARIKALIMPDEADIPDGPAPECFMRILEKYPDNSSFRWYASMEAALKDWPLTTAAEYNLLAHPEDAAS